MKNNKILLIEDDKIISKFIEGILIDIGYVNITKVYDSQTAFEKLSVDSFKIVLVDINIGDGKDGIEIINKLKQYPDIPFIYIIGYSDFKKLDKAMFRDADGIIFKPVREIDIKITLELIFNKNRGKNKEKASINSTTLKSITSREKEILIFVVNGLSNKMIGSLLNISDKTVSIHRTNLMKKVGAKNAADLVKIAMDNNLNTQIQL